MVIINIDTAKDPPDEIRKTIAYLQTLVGEKPADLSSQASPAPAVVSAPVSGGELPFGVEIFDDVQQPAPAQLTDTDSSTGKVKPEQKKPDAKKPEAERLLEESEEIEVVDENAGAFIEIVDMDEE